MSDFWSRIEGFFTGPQLADLITGLAILLIGLLAARYLSRGAASIANRRTSAQYALIVRRLTFYALAGLVIVLSLGQFGVDLSILLGAAGILTVAIGFASQTSASNLISGLFLLGERPFVVGDIVRVGSTTGVVLSIDLMSVKLRTFDNLFVRLPNETLLKSEIINLSHFPIRRLDVLIGVAYHEDVERVREVLVEVGAKNPVCLDEPKPLVLFLGFGDSSLNLQFSVWAASGNFLDLRNTVQEEVKNAFDAAGIEIPFPHRTLYAGSQTAPLPIRLVEGVTVS